MIKFLFNPLTGGFDMVDDSDTSAVWGSITGTLSDQTDLQSALDAKANALTADQNYVSDAELLVLQATSGTNTGDQTSIVGITGTKSQFDTAVTDGNFLYVGDITQYTDEMAQDAIGTMVSTAFTYTDSTPLLALTARTIGGVSFDGTANITVASATGGFTVSGGNLALGTNSITMSGSIGVTGTRVTKGWFTDLEVTNAIAGSITGNAATVTTNANLTGVVTSVGNATAIADSALSIAKTSGLQTALDAKAPLTSPTFATSITGSYLTASQILITDASKNIVSAAVATYPSLTELTYLKGVTSAIQTQIDGKMTNPMTTAGDIIYGGASGTPTRLADVATGNALISGGVGVAPAWGKIGLTTHISGTLPIANGGTNSASALSNQRVMTSVGGAIVESGAITDGEGIQRNDTTFISAPLPLNTVEGRLTTESGVAISTSDRTSQGTIYFTPYRGNRIYLYDGTRWKLYSFTEKSLALTLTSGKNYDVFIYDNSGTLTLELSDAWTNDTTRDDALTLQDGVYVKSGATTRRWLGTIRASGSNVTEDSGGGTSSQVGGKRFVWNYYNQVRRSLAVIDTTDSWSYTTGTWRQANAGAGSGNKVEYVTGDASMMVEGFLVANITAGSNSARGFYIGIGVDSITAISGINQAGYVPPAATQVGPLNARYAGLPGLGYHYLSWMENGADGTCNFLGDNGTPGTLQSGLLAAINA